MDEAYKAQSPQPKATDNWAVNKTKRSENFIKRTTQKSVGPGSYSLEASIDRSIKNPTIPRAEISKHFSDRFGPRKLKRKNKGSIRANWEDDDDSEEDEITPGPGAHLQHHHTSTFGMVPIVHDHP